MKEFLERFHENFIVGGFGYNSTGINKLIYFLTFIGFLVIGEYFFAYSFVEFVLSFLNIFFRESLSNGIFYLLACFMVGGSFYAVFFLFVLIKTIIFKKNSN